jgi:heptosyltransferase-2
VTENGEDCRYYDPTDSNILIIKLGATGDVIRTTPLLRKIKEVRPRASIWWLTLTPEILPDIVDVPLDFTPQGLAILQATHFDIVYNLDKDKEACAVASLVSSDEKKGFELKNGKCSPVGEDSAHKFLTGVFDDVSKANKKSYPEEIFEMCGFQFSGEKYILDVPANLYKWDIDKTGCGGRWTSRLWPDSNWIELASKLRDKGFEPIFLGGEQEHEKNSSLAAKSSALYLGHFPLRQFISLVDQCDLVVTAVTMAMHITIGLGKKIVLFNNIFNRNEFELYGLGEIVEPGKPCTCFFSPQCTNPNYHCMDSITVNKVSEVCERLLRN